MAGTLEGASGERLRPAPVLTAENEFFWRGAAEGKLLCHRCAVCGRLQHPPTPLCPHCHANDWGLVELSGRGTVASFIIIHHPPNPWFDLPIVAGTIDLEEGVQRPSPTSATSIRTPCASACPCRRSSPRPKTTSRCRSSVLPDQGRSGGPSSYTHTGRVRFVDWLAVRGGCRRPSRGARHGRTRWRRRVRECRAGSSRWAPTARCGRCCRGCCRGPVADRLAHPEADEVAEDGSAVVHTPRSGKRAHIAVPPSPGAPGNSLMARLGDAQLHRAHDRGRQIEAELAWSVVVGSRHGGEVDPLPLELVRSKSRRRVHGEDLLTLDAADRVPGS